MHFRLTSHSQSCSVWVVCILHTQTRSLSKTFTTLTLHRFAINHCALKPPFHFTSLVSCRKHLPIDISYACTNCSQMKRFRWRDHSDNARDNKTDREQEKKSVKQANKTIETHFTRTCMTSHLKIHPRHTNVKKKNGYIAQMVGRQSARRAMAGHKSILLFLFWWSQHGAAWILSTWKLSKWDHAHEPAAFGGSSDGGVGHKTAWKKVKSPFVVGFAVCLCHLSYSHHLKCCRYQ